MTNKTKVINAVYTQVLTIGLNRIRSSIRTLGNYKQVDTVKVHCCIIELMSR